MNQTELPNRKLSAAQINELPQAKWQGPTHVIQTRTEMEQAVPVIAASPLLGFDTETRPVFKKGQYNPPSLLQLATSTEVFIFQLTKTGLPEPIREILGNRAIQKVGVAIKDDLNELGKIGPFTPAGCTDISSLSKQLKLKHHGLRGLAAVVLGVRIAKSQQTSNWARKQLSPAQITYAATDAWMSREIFIHLQA